MSDTNGTVVPTATVETPAAAPAAAAPAAKAADPNAEPSWLNDRLDRERRSLLKKLGVDNIEDAQAAIADLKTKREAEKSIADKAAEALVRATTAENSTASLRAAVSEFASKQMQGLTPEQKAAVDAIAGEDPAQQLKAIAALMPTWATPVTPAAAPVASVDTAPAANAPAPLTVSPTNHKSQYEALRKSNPFAAAAYALAHSNEIYG